ncbi:hypothetical protein LCGC14_1064010 [marine sediment metagenome]|uniref:DNA polymerase III beta sliding clamp central domain-containing protein n=1 Tax=marine sediment metagenome TaxID=412755 RepID=A0A0F9QR57_9ZZZZ
MLIPASIMGIAKMAAPDSTRYAINGVQFHREESGECVATVTDGRCMLQIRWDDEEVRHNLEITGVSCAPVKGFSIIADARFCFAAAKRLGGKNAPSKRRYVLLDESAEKGVVRMATNDGYATIIATAPAAGDSFPDVESIIPKYTVGEDANVIGLYPEVFAGAMSVLAEAVESTKIDQGVCLIVPNDRTKPVLMRTKGEEACGIAVAMPCKIDGEVECR